MDLAPSPAKPVDQMTGDEILAELAANAIDVAAMKALYARRKALLNAGRRMEPKLTHQAMADAAQMKMVQVVRDTGESRQ